MDERHKSEEIGMMCTRRLQGESQKVLRPLCEPNLMLQKMQNKQDNKETRRANVCRRQSTCAFQMWFREGTFPFRRSKIGRTR